MLIDYCGQEQRHLDLFFVSVCVKYTHIRPIVHSKSASCVCSGFHDVVAFFGGMIFGGCGCEAVLLVKTLSLSLFPSMGL